MRRRELDRKARLRAVADDLHRAEQGRLAPIARELAQAREDAARIAETLDGDEVSTRLFSDIHFAYLARVRRRVDALERELAAQMANVRQAKVRAERLGEHEKSAAKMHRAKQAERRIEVEAEAIVVRRAARPR